MNCPNCNHQNIDGATYCGNCGSTLPVQPSVAAIPMQPQMSEAPAQVQSQVFTPAPPQSLPTEPNTAMAQNQAYVQAPVQTPPPSQSAPTSVQANTTTSGNNTAGISQPAIVPQPIATQFTNSPTPTADPSLTNPYAIPTSPQQLGPLPTSTSATDNTPLKTRIPVVKQFAITCMVLAVVYGALYLFNIVFAGISSAELSKAEGAPVPPIFMIVAGSIGLVGTILTFIGGRMANNATTADRVRTATTLGIIGCMIIVGLAGGIYGAPAVIGMMFGFMARRVLKKQGL